MRFLTTQWSMVLAAGDSAAAGSYEALNDLCSQYWYPVYAFARRRGASVEDAQDQVQGFFSHLFERGTLKGVDPARGRFRSFLLGAFKLYLSDERSRAAAQKRGGGATALPLDLEGAEERYRLEAEPAENPDHLFARRWALELLAHARRRLDEEIAAGRNPERRRLAVFLTEPDGAPYRKVAAELGMSEPAVKVAVHRLRQRYGALLREEVARTVEDPDRVDDELKYLFSVL